MFTTRCFVFSSLFGFVGIHFTTVDCMYFLPYPMTLVFTFRLGDTTDFVPDDSLLLRFTRRCPYVAVLLLKQARCCQPAVDGSSSFRTPRQRGDVTIVLRQPSSLLACRIPLTSPCRRPILSRRLPVVGVFFMMSMPGLLGVIDVFTTAEASALPQLNTCVCNAWNRELSAWVACGRWR